MKNILILIGIAFIYWFFTRKSEPEANSVAGSPGGLFSNILPTNQPVSTSQQPGTSLISGTTNSGTTNSGTNTSGTNTSGTNTSGSTPSGTTNSDYYEPVVVSEPHRLIKAENATANFNFNRPSKSCFV